MKTLLFLIILLLALTNTSSFQAANHEVLLKPKPWFFIFATNSEIGIKRRDCSGWGLSCLLDISYTEIFKQNNSQYAEIILLDSQNLSFTFYSAANELEKDFLVEDLSKNLFQKEAIRFGCSFLELIPGTYGTTKQQDGRINVILKVKSR